MASERVRRRAWGWVVLPVLAASLVALGLVAIEAATVEDAESGARRTTLGSVAFVGDSITANATRELEELGAPLADEILVEATGGAMAREQRDEAARLARGAPAVAVINLSTNDAACVLGNLVPESPCRYPGFTLDDLRADLVAVAREFDPSTTCIVGVDPTFSVAAGEVWRELVAAGEADGVVEWRAAAEARRDELLLDELGHLTPEGNRTYAELVWQEVREACG